MKGKKGFQSGHKDRFQSGARPVAPKPYCFRPYADQDLKSIDGLADKLRAYVDELLKGVESRSD